MFKLVGFVREECVVTLHLSTGSFIPLCVGAGNECELGYFLVTMCVIQI